MEGRQTNVNEDGAGHDRAPRFWWSDIHVVRASQGQSSA